MSPHRLSRLRETIRNEKLDAFIVSSLPNVRYISGFTGSSGLCVVRESDAFFLTDSRYTLQSKLEVKSLKRIIAKHDLYEQISESNLLDSCCRVGFESHAVTYAQYRRLRRSTSGSSFVPTKDVVEAIAVVKEKDEIGYIRDAALISGRVFDDLLGSIKPGVAELDIAAEISYLHRKYGGERDAFEPIVASGVRGALPHARASSKRIKNGEFVTLDFGCTVRGYNSDITRTVAVGKISARARRIYDVVLTAQRDAIEAVKPGMWAKDLDSVARNRIKGEGYGRFFNHSLGHGLGLQVHECPRISSMSKERLVAGSVITIEPGVYIPEFGGVRIEDDILITVQGCTVLTESPRDLIFT